MNLIYIDDYKMDEESLLRSIGVNSVRLTKEDALTKEGFLGLNANNKYQVRGPRMTVVEYEKIWGAATLSGIALATSPRSFEIGASFGEQYELFREMSPGALVFVESTSDNDIFEAIIARGLCFPIFVRSDLESAAKYIGIDGCIVQKPTLGAVSQVISNLRANVKGFSSLIFKEVAEIAVHPATGKRLEYRAIGIDGRLITFDFDNHKDNLPSQEDFGLVEFVNKAFTKLAHGNADGGLFLDVALTTSNVPIVVECKNLMNGTISSLTRFGEALVRTV